MVLNYGEESNIFKKDLDIEISKNNKKVFAKFYKTRLKSHRKKQKTEKI
jgi:hypothetical protein